MNSEDIRTVDIYDIERMIELVRFVQKNIEETPQRKNCTATLEVLAARVQELTR